MPVDVPALAPYHDQYAPLARPGVGVPFRVVLRFHNALEGFDALHLDNLLALLVVAEATSGNLLPPSPEPYRLPVPLTPLWWDAEGLPLWAATQFRPVGGDGAPHTDVQYRHKRAVAGVNPVKGRWQEMRQPYAGQLAPEGWEAFAVGDPHEVARLLHKERYFGKKRAVGAGHLADMTVEPAPWSLVTANGRLARSVPGAAATALGVMGTDALVLVDWTPPQWLPALLRPGWPAGTPALSIAGAASLPTTPSL
jgi:hypothetical protein